LNDKLAVARLLTLFRNLENHQEIYFLPDVFRFQEKGIISMLDAFWNEQFVNHVILANVLVELLRSYPQSQLTLQPSMS